jgi:PHD and RING finger domain-containing protein 1
VICDGGAASSTTVPLAASMLDSNTDGQSEMCPICLCGFVTQEVGTPEACNHSFCTDFLQGWLKNTNTCPIDGQVCDTILVCRSLGGEVVRSVHLKPPRQQEEVKHYFMHCEVCCDSNHFCAIIHCDRCGQDYHLECLYPPFDTVPLEEWFCNDCS